MTIQIFKKMLGALILLKKNSVKLLVTNTLFFFLFHTQALIFKFGIHLCISFWLLLMFTYTLSYFRRVLHLVIDMYREMEVLRLLGEINVFAYL